MAETQDRLYPAPVSANSKDWCGPEGIRIGGNNLRARPWILNLIIQRNKQTIPVSCGIIPFEAGIGAAGITEHLLGQIGAVLFH